MNATSWLQEHVADCFYAAAKQAQSAVRLIYDTATLDPDAREEWEREKREMGRASAALAAATRRATVRDASFEVMTALYAARNFLLNIAGRAERRGCSGDASVLYAAASECRRVEELAEKLRLANYPPAGGGRRVFTPDEEAGK